MLAKDLNFITCLQTAIPICWQLGPRLSKNSQAWWQHFPMQRLLLLDSVQILVREAREGTYWRKAFPMPRVLQEFPHEE
ncbi:hypothetical protein JTE90_019485 [Oedothorax gibbosus]|uniref:Uncharacterized protein n=1 Tax=Oedothorax gibbosus TaxID=931172 RepID=A0AAV6ULZ1_9ARAC|nr:hypothetical protein JTE90_019485 [Oedothorax gibbosus]